MLFDTKLYRKIRCKNCPKKREKDISTYTWKMIDILLLQKGGYQFQNNDLTLEQWLHLGKLKQWLEIPH